MNSSDFYPALTDNNPIRITCLVTCLVTILLGFPFHLGVLWFERFGSDKKRTILNMLVSEVIWLMVGFVAVIQFPEIFRFTYGPLPESLCFLQLFARNSLVFTITLLLNAISIWRFVFIFCLKNPAAFRDNFWFLYSSLVIHLFSILYWGTCHFVAAYQPVVFYICTGQNSEEAIKHPFKGYGTIEVFSFVVNTFIYIKIYFHKQKISPEPHTYGFSMKVLSMSEMDKANLVNYFFVFSCLSFLSTTFMTVAKVNSIPAKDFNMYPNYLWSYYRSLVVPTLSSIFVIIWFYSKKNLRQKVWDQFLNEVYYHL